MSSAIVRYGPPNQDVSSTNPASPTVLDTIALHPGSYVITANALGTGGQLGDGNDQMRDRHRRRRPTPSGESLTSQAQGSVEMTRPVSLSANATYKLNCYRANANDMRLVRTQLTAIEVGAVTTQ